MWWPLLLLKIVTPIIMGLASALLLTAIFTDSWVVRQTPLGLYHEDLWSYCFDSTCFSMGRRWGYKISVISFLSTGAIFSVILPVVLLVLYICKTNKFLNKRFKETLIIPAMTTMIGMSFYTGRYTSEIDYEHRGFSYWLAWSSFPIFLVAAFAGLCHNVLQEIEEENEITSNVFSGN